MKKITIIALIIIGIGGLLIARYAYPKAKVTDCPKIPVTNHSTIEAIKETFDPSKPPERILTANTAMNHTPHVLRIVKDTFVIFKYEGAGVYAEQAENNDGFILMETIDWNKNIKRQTRYDYEGGKFIPVWYQEGCKK